MYFNLVFRVSSGLGDVDPAAALPSIVEESVVVVVVVAEVVADNDDSQIALDRPFPRARNSDTISGVYDALSNVKDRTLEICVPNDR